MDIEIYVYIGVCLTIVFVWTTLHYAGWQRAIDFTEGCIESNFPPMAFALIVFMWPMWLAMGIVALAVIVCIGGPIALVAGLGWLIGNTIRRMRHV